MQIYCIGFILSKYCIMIIHLSRFLQKNKQAIQIKSDSLYPINLIYFIADLSISITFLLPDKKV